MITADPYADHGESRQDGELTDAEVILLSRQHPEVFASLFRRHGPPIQRYVARRLGPDAADDVLAETFLIAFEQRTRYDGTRANALPWLYGIATNLVGRHRRAEVRQLKAFSRSGVDPVVAAFTDAADDRLSADATKPRLAAALAGLRPGYRDALLLVAWGGLSYEEASAALQIPVGTVRSRINRARTRLRSALGGTDPTSLEHS